MFIKRYILLLIITLPLFPSVKYLSLNQAIEILKKDNLELKISRFNEQIKAYEVKAVEGLNYGKLDLTVAGMRSNDAGNVFGFKLQSREATFGDFGAGEFIKNSAACQGRNMQACQDMLGKPPSDLNYPGARNHFQAKLSYLLPLYTGGKLTEYKHITESMQQMSKFDTKQLLNAKFIKLKKHIMIFHWLKTILPTLQKLCAIFQNWNRLFFLWKQKAMHRILIC